MTNEQVWVERVRAWQESGQSKADFCRGEGYTASGLGYWVKRLGHATTAAAPVPAKAKAAGVQVARVVRASPSAPSRTTDSASVARLPVTSSAGQVVVEVISVRTVAPGHLASAQLDSILASLVRGHS